jgi:protein subunit release factor B
VVDRQLVLSITLHDCRVDVFRSGGKGGQHQNCSDTGVRIVHEPSGAVGESREQRSQLQNKKAAFKRMAAHPKLKVWLNKQLHERSGDGNRGYAWKFEGGRWVRNEPAGIDPREIKVERRHNGQWLEWTDD